MRPLTALASLVNVDAAGFALKRPALLPSARDETSPGTDSRKARFKLSSNGFKRRRETFESVSLNLNRGFCASRIGRPRRSVSLIEATALRDEEDAPPGPECCSTTR